MAIAFLLLPDPPPTPARRQPQQLLVVMLSRPWLAPLLLPTTPLCQLMAPSPSTKQYLRFQPTMPARFTTAPLTLDLPNRLMDLSMGKPAALSPARSPSPERHSQPRQWVPAPSLPLFPAYRLPIIILWLSTALWPSVPFLPSMLVSHGPRLRK